MPSSWTRAAITLPVENDRQPRNPSPSPISGPAPRLPSSSCQNISEMPAEPEERAERHARPERLAEKDRGKSDIGQRGKREDDREEAGHDVLAGIVEEEEVGRVEEEAERRKAKVRAQRERDALRRRACRRGTSAARQSGSARRARPADRPSRAGISAPARSCSRRARCRRRGRSRRRQGVARSGGAKTVVEAMGTARGRSDTTMRWSSASRFQPNPSDASGQRG